MAPLSRYTTLMLLTNLTYSLGAFLADWSKTHVLNPRWPPHARFHNGQTMSLGLCLASLSTYLLLRPAGSVQTAKDNVWLAALVGSFYCAAGISAIAYPGTAWADPEFYVPYAPQSWLFGGLVVLNWWGYWGEVGRLGREGRAKVL